MIEKKEIERLQQERLRLQQEIEKARLQEETEKARAEQEIKARRSSLVSVTRVRFPNLTEFARQQVELFDKPEVLDLLIQQVVAAPDANTVRLLLRPSLETHE